MNKKRAAQQLGWGENSISRYMSDENDMSCNQLNKLIEFAIEKKVSPATINMLTGGVCNRIGYGKFNHE